MKNKGCLNLFIWLIAILFLLPFAIIGGFIYLMVRLYKGGKFDNITNKVNDLIKNIYFKISKKELNKNIFSPKSFTITFTIFIVLFIGSFGNSNTTEIKNENSVVSSNSISTSEVNSSKSSDVDKTNNDTSTLNLESTDNSNTENTTDTKAQTSSNEDIENKEDNTSNTENTGNNTYDIEDNSQDTSSNSEVIYEPEPASTQETSQTSQTVYWTPNGKSYHSSASCPTLSRSKTILSGTQAESGKSDPCDRCN